MFPYPSDKIETFAAYFFVISMIVVIVWGLITLFSGGILSGIMILGFGSFSSYFSTLLLYSFACLVEGSAPLPDNHKS